MTMKTSIIENCGDFAKVIYYAEYIESGVFLNNQH